MSDVGITPDKFMSPDIDETPIKGESVRECVKRLARMKAMACPLEPDHVILAADTLIELGGKIVGKAESEDEARAILKKHSGKRVRVVTGVCLRKPDNKLIEKVVVTRVSLKHMEHEEIESYVASGGWKGIAGCVNVRGNGQYLIKSINGSMSNTIGLPMYEVVNMLRSAGYDV